MSDVLDWAEKAGAENMKFHAQCAESLSKDSTTTLTVLLAGVGGALAFAAKGFDSVNVSIPLTVGSGVLSVWFMTLAAVLIHCCVRTSNLSPPTNEPANLYQPTFALKDLREIELVNLQQRIHQVVARNERVAAWLDRVRYLAASSPVVFTVSALAVAYWPALCALGWVAG